MPDIATLKAAAAAAILSLPTPNMGETPEARQVRLGDTIAGAVAESATRATCAPPWDQVDEPCKRIWPGSTVELMAVQIGTGWFESGFAEWVHAGRCRLHLGECDAEKRGGVLVAGSVSIFQLKLSAYTREAWPEIVGTGYWSTFQAAWSAARVLASVRRMCAYRRPAEPWLHATIAGYARGGRCRWSGSAKRAPRIISIEARLHQEIRRITQTEDRSSVAP